MPAKEPSEVQKQHEKGNEQDDTRGNTEKDENSLKGEEDQNEADIGEFDDIFSDISDSDEDSSDDGYVHLFMIVSVKTRWLHLMKCTG